jgi:hypothetical protein
MACIIERDGSTGFDWCKKRDKRKGKKSQTPGKMKSLNCQATPLERYIARRNRSYKHPGYSTWCASHTGVKK